MMRMRKMLTALLLLLGASAMAPQAGQSTPDQDHALELTTQASPRHDTLVDTEDVDRQADETIDFIAAICYLLVTIGCFSLFFHIIGEDKSHHAPAS